MKLTRALELPLSPRAAGDRTAEAAGRLKWQVRERSDAEMTLWRKGRLSQLQLGITVTAGLEPVEAGRTRVTLTSDVWRWRRLRRQVVESLISDLTAGVAQRPTREESIPPQMERWLIRFAIAVLAIASLTFSLTIDIPQREAPASAQTSAGGTVGSTQGSTGSDKSNGTEEEEDALPAIALDQPVIYRSEICLGVFYLGLLLLVPLYYGIIRGRIPTEISARGASFAADEITGSLDATEQRIEQLDQRLVAAEGLIALTRSQLSDEEHSDPQKED